MKKVFSNHNELAHVWAQNNQSEGRASRMFFRAGRLYSYGEHFCIAKILDDGVVVFTLRDYSPSTSQHKADARSAVSHRKIVYCYDPDRTAHSNREHTERQIKSSLEEAKTERKVLPKTRVESKLHALSLAEQFNEYNAALHKNERTKPFKLAKLAVSEADRLLLREYKQQLQAKREAKWEKDREKRAVMLAKLALSESEKIAEWRAHICNHPLHSVPAMLRLSRDGQNVETSQGANIPVSHAKRLWPLIENVRAWGMPLVDRDFRLGHYTLNTINKDGSIVVGCHRIAYDEIERIANALGLKETQDA